jgi:predicted small integral membrane protein
VESLYHSELRFLPAFRRFDTMCHAKEIHGLFLRDADQPELQRRHAPCPRRLLPHLSIAGEAMTLRFAKLLLVFAVASFYTVVVFNNITDYDANFQFVRHVLMMDSNSMGNHEMWRALNSPAWHTAFYVSVISWEFLVMLLCWWGEVRLARSLSAPAAVFMQAKCVSLIALTLALLMWLVAFLTVGGEWFLMWQSKTWNGQEAAFRMFTVIGIVLLLLAQSDVDNQP